MKKAVLFDFDGTLFMGTARLNAWCFERALNEMGLPPATPEMIDQTVGMTFAQIARLMTRSTDPQLQQRFGKTTFQYVPEYICRYVRPVPELSRMLEALRDRAALAICSNAVADYLLPMTRALQIADCFDLIWPFREGYRKSTAIPRILKEFNAEKGIFVGDRMEDVISARDAGIPVVGMRNPVFPRETDTADITVENHQQMQRAIETLLQEE